MKWWYAWIVAWGLTPFPVFLITIVFAGFGFYGIFKAINSVLV